MLKFIKNPSILFTQSQNDSSQNNFTILNLIKSYSVLSQNNLDEYMCIFDSQILEQYSEQWEYNRNLNDDKITAICNIIKTKPILDTVLHFFI